MCIRDRFKPAMNQVGGDTTHGAIVSAETGGMQGADDGEAIVLKATAATMIIGRKFTLLQTMNKIIMEDGRKQKKETK